MNTKDSDYLRMAITNSQRSMDEGNFPAGAIVVLHDEIIASEVNSPYPGLFHADSKAITTAFNKKGVLTEATLYIGLESCLMCTGVAYWSGIRRIVYAIPKSKVSGDYYETPKDTSEIMQTFNNRIETVHIPELEEQALSIVRAWEKKQGITIPQ